VALAVAGFIVLLNVTGTISADNGIDVTYVGNGALSSGPEGTGATCAGTYAGPDTINVTMGSLAGEGDLQVHRHVRSDGLAPARLQNFILASEDFAGRKQSTGTYEKRRSAASCYRHGTPEQAPGVSVFLGLLACHETAAGTLRLDLVSQGEIAHYVGVVEHIPEFICEVDLDDALTLKWLESPVRGTTFLVCVR
jgi:hypothetical protein